MKFQKTYLSRAMTRAMALDHPIGDPTGGPAYGEKNDPVSAVMSIAAMGSTYAAAGTFAAMTLTQGLVFAGAALSLVGNVTGNKTLSKIGMVAGIAGGVGMLAETITGSTFGGDMRVGDLAGETVTQQPSAASASLSGSPVETAAQAPVAEAGTQAVQGGPVAAEAAGTPVATANVNAPPAPTGVPLQAVDAAAPAAAVPQAAAAPASYDSFGTPAPAGSPAAVSADPSGLAQTQLDANAAARLAAEGKPGLVSQFMKFTKENPMLAYIGAQAVGGVGSYMTAQDEREYQEKLRNERLRRLNAGYQNVNQGMRVTPQMAVPVNPQQFAAASLPVQQVQPAGLIAAARG